MLAVALGIAFIGISCMNPPPLMLTPEDVDGPWPFHAAEFEIPCCEDGLVGVTPPDGSPYYFAGPPL